MTRYHGAANELEPASDLRDGSLAKHIHQLISERRTRSEPAIALWQRLKPPLIPCRVLASSAMKVLLEPSCNRYRSGNWSWSRSPITWLFVQYKPYFSLFLGKDASCCVWMLCLPGHPIQRVSVAKRNAVWVVSSELSWLLSTPWPQLTAVWQPPVTSSAGTGHGASSAQNYLPWILLSLLLILGLTSRAASIWFIGDP